MVSCDLPSVSHLECRATIVKKKNQTTPLGVRTESFTWFHMIHAVLWQKQAFESN